MNCFNLLKRAGLSEDGKGYISISAPVWGVLSGRDLGENAAAQPRLCRVTTGTGTACPRRAQVTQEGKGHHHTPTARSGGKRGLSCSSLRTGAAAQPSAQVPHCFGTQYPALNFNYTTSNIRLIKSTILARLGGRIKSRMKHPCSGRDSAGSREHRAPGPVPPLCPRTRGCCSAPSPSRL